MSLLPVEAQIELHRHDERRLLTLLRHGDPLALAALYNRTAVAAHTGASRLLGDAREIEALLTQVYFELWLAPPELDECPEGWVRRRCFNLGAARLQQAGRAPAAPSTALLLPTVAGGDGAAAPAPASALDPLERSIAALPELQRMALLRAADAGIPAAQQRAWLAGDDADQADLSAALTAALRHLAGAPPSEQAPACPEPRAADWVLGLLDIPEADEVAARVAREPTCTALVEELRAGRRRLDGPPPPAELGPRILAAVLARSGAVAPRPTRSAPTVSAPVEPAMAEPVPPAVEPAPPAPAPAADPADQAGQRAADAGELAEVAGAGSTAANFLRMVLGMLLLLAGVAVGVYVGQAIIAAL